MPNLILVIFDLIYLLTLWQVASQLAQYHNVNILWFHNPPHFDISINTEEDADAIVAPVDVSVDCVLQICVSDSLYESSDGVAGGGIPDEYVVS